MPGRRPVAVILLRRVLESRTIALYTITITSDFGRITKVPIKTRGILLGRGPAWVDSCREF